MGIIEKIIVDNATLARLEDSARLNGRTLEQEAAETLTRAIRQPKSEDILRRLDEVAAMTPKGVKQTNSTILLREDRER